MSDDVFSTVNNALGLFNNIDRLREQSTLKERGDAIAKALADNGGDFHALDPKLYSDRAGMAALASHVTRGLKPNRANRLSSKTKSRMPSIRHGCSASTGAKSTRPCSPGTPILPAPSWAVSAPS